MQEVLQDLVEKCLVEGSSAEVMPALGDQTSYTGMQTSIPAEHPAFLLPSDHVAVVTAEAILRDAIELTEGSGVWRFATDGGHFAQAGQTVIGFGPGDDSLAHTVQESIEADL